MIMAIVTDGRAEPPPVRIYVDKREPVVGEGGENTMRILCRGVGYAVLGLALSAGSFAVVTRTLNDGTAQAQQPPLPAKPPAFVPPIAQPVATAPAATAQPTVGVPPPETLLALVRINLLALDSAIKTENFSVLRAMSAPELQQKLSVEQLSAAFTNLRAQRLDLTAVAIVTPEITETPVVLQNNILRLVGAFPTNPMQLKFEMLFQPSNGMWRMLGMNVGAVPIAVAQAAPSSVAPPTGGSNPPVEKKKSNPAPKTPLAK